MKKQWLVLSLALCLLAGFAAGLVVRWPAGAGARGDGPPTLSPPVKGPDDALVTIVEVSEFQCPYCRRAALDVMPEVMQMFPGKVAVEFWHNPLPFHDMAEPAARAAVAARLQGRFWEMHDLLFKNQKSLSADRLVALAAQAGLDTERFRWDMADPRVKDYVSQNMQAAQAVGLRGTPMFIVNGTVIRGAQPADKFRTLVEEEIKRAEEALAAGTPRNELRAAMARAGGADEKFVKLFIEQNWESLPGAAAGPEKKKSKAGSPPPVAADETVWQVPVSPDDPAIGPADAPVTVVLFSEFQCPYCRKATGVLQQLLEDLPGQVRIVFKHFPLPFHKDAPLAAEAAQAAHAQGRFWEMHDLLFDNQRALSQKDLVGHARELGLDEERFRRELADDVHAATVEQHLEQGRNAGVRGTPNFFVNGRVIKGAVPYDQLKAVVDQELARGQALRKQGIADVYGARTKDGKVFSPFADESETAAFDTAESPAIGPEKAELEVVLFSDFECPYCSRVAEPLQELRARYKDRMRLVFKNFPLPTHKAAQLAAEAALAAHEQGRFWEMHDLLFKNRSALGRPNLDRLAHQLGLDERAFARALDDGRFKERIQADKREGHDAGVQGTPTLFVNGRQYQGPTGDPEQMARAIDKEFPAR